MSKLSIEKTEQNKVFLNKLKTFKESIFTILDNSKISEENRYSTYKTMAQFYNDLVNQAKLLLNDNDDTLIYFNIAELGTSSSTVWTYQKSIMEQIYVAIGILISTFEGNLNFVDDEFENFENFILSKLRSVIFKKPEKEKEIQDAIESLFIGKGLNKGVDYFREAGKFEFSGKEYIPDFVIPKLKLCIEVKLVREGRVSRIIDEISADITAYNKKYDRQLFVVYDLGNIQNEIEFKHDIENVGNIKIIIIKH